MMETFTTSDRFLAALIVATCCPSPFVSPRNNAGEIVYDIETRFDVMAKIFEYGHGIGMGPRIKSSLAQLEEAENRLRSSSIQTE